MKIIITNSLGPISKLSKYYYRHIPWLGKIKLKEFAEEFANASNSK